MVTSNADRPGDLLRVEGLRIAIRTFRSEVEVVRGASFRVPRGKTVALVGESGSGKSIIAQAILGILPPVARIAGGAIRFDDPAGAGPVDIAGLDADGADMRSLRGGRISIIFQEPMTSLSPVHTIGNQVEEALLLHREVKPGDARRLTEETLGLVGFPDPHHAYDMYPSELSGGLRQRAMIAMALICRPALLIADEPTTALDVTIQAQVLAVLKRLQAQLGMSLLLITHDLGVVANMADEIVVIYHGAIVEAGPTKAILTDPRHPYLKALLAAVPRVDMAPDETLRSIREIDEALPDSMARKAEERPDRSGAPLLTVEGLSKTYVTRKGKGLFGVEKKAVHAVSDVSFEVRAGECFGLVGESGCGKSSLSRIISRAITADEGRAIFDNGRETVDILKLKGRALTEFRPRIQMVFQDPFSSLSPRSTVLNILTEPLEIHGRGDSAWRRQRAVDLLRLVGLPQTSLSRYPHSFSGGQRQRIGIARALALEPDLLICDEPVSALDVSVQAQILNLIARLQKELGLTIIFISHNLAVVNYVANRIAVMQRGRIVEIAPRGVLFERPVHPYTQRLLRSIPTVDLDRKLDLDAALADVEEGPEEATWDPVFRQDASGQPLGFVEVGPDHVVLARRSLDPERLVA